MNDLAGTRTLQGGVNIVLSESRVRLQRKCPDERRDHIIAVAAKAFAKTGYGLTSMSVIAAQLGGSKATLYRYFPSKVALLEAVMQARCQRVLAPLKDLRGKEGDDLEHLLSEFGATFLAKMYDAEAIDLHRLVHAEGARFPELRAIFFRSGPDAVLRELGGTLARFAAAGMIECPDVMLAAGQFLGMLRGDRHMRYIVGQMPAADSAEIRHHAEHAARVMARGLMRRRA